MDEKSLTQILAEGENQTQAFLVDLSDPWNAAVIISSLANGKGGSLWIGVKPNGKIVGVYPEGILQELNALKERFFQKPTVLHTKTWKSKMHFVLQVLVESTPKNPEYLINDRNQTVLFERHGNKNIQASKIALKNMQFRSQDKELPEELSDSEKEILAFIQKSKQLSLSQMYKHLDIEMSQIDVLVSQLVYRNLVEMDFSSEVTLYKSKGA